MNCERCGANPGTIRYTEVGDGELKKLRICADCAAELGFEIGGETPTPKVSPVHKGKVLELVSAAAAIESDPEETASEKDDRRCPSCGLTGTEFNRTSLFGCPECYVTFEDGLDPLLKRLHAAVSHRGRLPGGRSAEPPDLAVLRRELREAIRAQDFEAAARVRDRLRQAGVRDLDDGSGEQSS